MNRWKSFHTTRRIADLFQSSSRVTPLVDSSEDAELPEINGQPPLCQGDGLLLKPSPIRRTRSSVPVTSRPLAPRDGGNDSQPVAIPRRLPSLNFDTSSRTSTPSPGPMQSRHQFDGSLLPPTVRGTRRKSSTTIQRVPETFEVRRCLADMLQGTVSPKHREGEVTDSPPCSRFGAMKNGHGRCKAKPF